MNEKFNQDVQQALEANNGFVEAPNFVLMSIDVYRNTMGVESDEELQRSLAAINKSWQEAKDGQLRPFTDAMKDIRTKHDLQG